MLPLRLTILTYPSALLPRPHQLFVSSTAMPAATASLENQSSRLLRLGRWPAPSSRCPLVSLAYASTCPGRFVCSFQHQSSPFPILTASISLLPLATRLSVLVLYSIRSWLSFSFPPWQSLQTGLGPPFSLRPLPRSRSSHLPHAVVSQSSLALRLLLLLIHQPPCTVGPSMLLY